MTTARLDPARAEALVRAVAGLVKTQGLYPPGHAAEARAVEAAHRALGAALAEGEPVLVGEAGGYLVVGDVHLVSEHAPHTELWLDRLRAREAEGVLFSSLPSEGELARFTRWFRGEGAGPWAGKAITVTRLKKESVWSRATAAHRAAVDALEEAHREVEAGRIPDPSRARGCVARFSELLGERPTVLRGLVLLKDYDRYTFNHSVNVCLLALGLGQHLGLSGSELESLGVGGLFHDIGKTRTPAEVVRKPGRLTEGEWHLIWQHPVQGRAILLGMGRVAPAVPRIAYEHHMWYDGHGYPEEPPGYEIHPLSLLVAVADAYDAMTTHRSYSEPRPLPEAIGILRGQRETHFAPRALDALVAVVGALPVGSLVRLTTGEVAVVAALDDAGGVERVTVVVDADGRRIEAGRAPHRRVGPGDVVRWVNPLAHGIDPVAVLQEGDGEPAS